MKRIEIVVQLMVAIYSRESTYDKGAKEIIEHCEEMADIIIERDEIYREENY